MWCSIPYVSDALARDHNLRMVSSGGASGAIGRRDAALPVDRNDPTDHQRRYAVTDEGWRQLDQRRPGRAGRRKCLAGCPEIRKAGRSRARCLCQRTQTQPGAGPVSRCHRHASHWSLDVGGSGEGRGGYFDPDPGLLPGRYCPKRGEFSLGFAGRISKARSLSGARASGWAVSRASSATAGWKR